VDLVPVTYEELRDRVKAWTAPVPGASPAGAPAKFDPEYQAVANEVAKLDLPSGGAVNWKLVNEKAGAILAAKSKDLVIASCLAHGLHVTGGLAGLTSGCVLLIELMQQFWDTAFPDVKRLRGRANALQWFVEKTQAAIARPQAGVKFEDVEALEAASVKLGDLAREKYADLAPAFGSILEVVARLKAESAPPPPPPPPPPAPEPTAEAPAAGAPQAPAEAPKVPALAAPEDLYGFLVAAGASLIQAATALRQADSKDPLAYRLLRIGCWLPCTAEPAAEGGKTQVPPPGWRSFLAEQAAGTDRAALLEAAEGAAAESPFWIDPHRVAWEVLDAMGATHHPARDAVAAELGGLLARMPGLSALAFDDGSPLADAQTQAWIEAQLATGSGGGASGSRPSAAARRTAGARDLLVAGQLPAALAAAREAVAGAQSERERFAVRLEVARLFTGAGLHALAQSSYAELDREAQARGLDAWEPALAAECLRGLIVSTQALSADPRGVSPDLVMSYRRLCRLDPALAHEVWP
jgi:type VI secretion system protein VasJ